MAFISSPETVSISPSDVITTTLRFQSNRLPAHIPRVGHSRVGEQEERTLGYAGTKVVDDAFNNSGLERNLKETSYKEFIKNCGLT